MKIYQMPVVFVLLAFVASVDADEPLSSHPRVTTNIALLEAWIESQMAYHAIPGMCIAIVHDQDIIYSKGFGYADLNSNRETTTESLYRIASHSKLFTAISIMQLRDAGKLDLDDPVTKHLSWFKLDGEDTSQRAVTIRHLLTHSSGIPREAGRPYWTDFNFPTTDEIIERLPSQEVVFPSETKWKYSNLAFALLGEVVQEISGKPFEEYVQHQIFEPLGMSNSGVTLSQIDQNQLARGYGRRLPDGTREKFPTIDAKGMAAAAGVTSSVADMARFVSWQFRLRNNGVVEVLQPATLREMQRVHWLDPKWKEGWGLAFEIIKTESRLLVGHNGGYPGFKTSTFISPAEKIAVIVFANALDAQPYPGETLSVVDRAFDWVGDAISEVKSGTKTEPAKTSWKPLIGNYRFIWGDYRVQALDGDLVVLNIAHPNPKATISKLQPIDDSERSFRVTEGSPVFPLGETVVFEMGEGDQVDRMMFGQLELKRMDYRR